MDGDGLAQSAVEVVAQHLAQRGTDAVGRLADADVDHIYQLIVSRLQRSPAGQGMLSWFHQNPAGEQSRRRFAVVVADEVRHDPGFAESLGQAAERAGVFVQGADASQQIIENSGDFRDISAGRDVRIKQRQFHIGRFQVGTGGLVTGVIGLVILLGGGTVAAVVVATDQANPVALRSVVGRWERPGDKPLPGFQTSPTILTIFPDGRFTFSAGIQMNFPAGERSPGGGTGAGFPDFSGIRIDCNGTVEPKEGHFTLRPTAGQCGTVEAELSADGSILDVGLSNGSRDGSTAFTKVSP